MDVCIPRPAEGDFLGQLRALLDPDVRVVDGACHVLVEGVPTREQIEASPELRAVLIPYAGVPRKTRELVAKFPGVTIKAELAYTVHCVRKRTIDCGWPVFH